MGTGFAAVPDAPAFVLANATLPAVLVDGFAAAPDAQGLVVADITVAGGRIASIAPTGSASGPPALDLKRGMAWPSFVDMHTHLDKGHIWPRAGSPDGTFAEALEGVRRDRQTRWSAEDVAQRMDFSLRCAYAHGTALIRTHIDSDPPQHRISWPVFSAMRERWAGRIEMQGVSIFSLDNALDDVFFPELADIVTAHRGVLGAFVFPFPRLREALTRVIRAAAEHGLDLDLHVDETLDPSAQALRLLADLAIEHHFPGRITAGHCCSLSVQPESEAAETMDRVAEAGIGVVSLPMCNLFLQDRVRGRTPRLRGVAPLHELAGRGIPVAVASDNTRDPFYGYGDLDMLEVFRESVRIAHLDIPAALWPAAVARTPAAMMGMPERGVLRAGGPADLVLFRAREYSELLSRPQHDRTVLRAGAAIDTALPDYAELDGIMHR